MRSTANLFIWWLGLGLVLSPSVARAGDSPSQEGMSAQTEVVRPFQGSLFDLPVQPAGSEPEIEHAVPDPATFAMLKARARTLRRSRLSPQVAPVTLKLLRVSTAAPRASYGVVTAASSTLVSFPGLDYVSSGKTGPAADVTLAKTPTRVLEATNAGLQLLSPTGTALQTRSTSSFLVGSEGLKTTDPRLYYDRNSTNPRVYFVVLESASFSTKSSALWLAVSRASDPADLNPASWCRYRFDGVRNPGTPNASFADFPGLGAGADAVLISTNQFRFTDGTFTYAIVRTFNKAQLANNAGACPSATVTTMQPSATIGDLSATTLQPVQHYTSPSSFTGTTSPAYLVSTDGLTAGGPFSGNYRVWRVRNVAGGAPSIASVNVIGIAYETPPSALQPVSGPTPLLNTLDSRVHQAAGLGDSIWLALSTGCEFFPFGSGDIVSCIQIARLDVAQGSGGSPTATYTHQILFGGGSGHYYWMPSIAVNSAQQIGVAFLYSSATEYLSSAWMIKNPSSPALPPIQPLVTGTCTTGSRTGDYSGAQTDPNLVNFWLASEAASPFPADPCLWKTTVVQGAP